LSYNGRVDQGMLNNEIGVNVKLLVEQYKKNFNYPSWFENTMNWALEGKISPQSLQLAADNLLNRGDMTMKPAAKAGFDKSKIEHYIEQYHGDDIKLLHEHASRFGTKLEEAKGERTSLQGKIDKLNLDSQLFHDMHTDQETRITRNAEMIGSHTHDDEGKPCACEWYDIACKFDCASGTIGKIAIVGGIGILAFFLLKKRIGL